MVIYLRKIENGLNGLICCVIDPLLHVPSGARTAVGSGQRLREENVCGLLSVIRFWVVLSSNPSGARTTLGSGQRLREENVCGLLSVIRFLGVLSTNPSGARILIDKRSAFAWRE